MRRKRGGLVSLYLCGKGNRREGNQRSNQDHQDHSIVEIGQDTEKSPEKLLPLPDFLPKHKIPLNITIMI